ncbi:hypothetical protein MGA447_1553 [Enterococcus faecalis]|nr:hypothetical protein MGA447_1553 [Enterococcus faecalis]
MSVKFYCKKKRGTYEKQTPTGQTNCDQSRNQFSDLSQWQY